MKHHYLIVGKQYLALKEKILARGDDYTLLQDHNATKFPNKLLKRRIVADFTDTDELLQTARTIHSQKPITGVLSIYENYVLPTAHIAKALGLPGMPIAAAEACTDKYLMRQKFAGAPQPISPDFAEASTAQEALEFARSHEFPLVLKPANLAKSLLVLKVSDAQELVESFQRMTSSIGAVYQKYAPLRQPKIIIEEFMEGPIYSVDGYVLSDGQPLILDEVVDYQTGYDIGYDDNFHYSRLLPSALPESEIQKIRGTAKLGMQALNMRNSPAHIEIIRTAQGPRIVEIGARNGGYRERMHKLANGIDIFDAWLNVAIDQIPDITATKHESCAVLELFPKNPGTFSKISHLDDLQKLPSFHYVSVKAKPGVFVGKAADGFKMCAVVILHHADGKQFAKDLAYCNDYVAVQTS